MKKLLLNQLIIATLFLGSPALLAMEEGAAKEPETQGTPFQESPSDSKFAIVEQLIESSKTLEEAVKNIRALSHTNKELYQLINDQQKMSLIIKKLVDNFIKTDQKNVPLYQKIIAAYLGTGGSIKWLIEHDPKKWIHWEIMFALEKDKPNKPLLRAALKTLINAGFADADAISPKRGLFLLEKAIAFEDSDIIEFLLKKGAKANPKTLNEILHFAVEKGNAPMVDAVLKAGANVNAGHTHTKTGYSGYSWTPLHEATRRKNLAIVKILLKNGANPNIGDIVWNIPPIVQADLPTARELLKAGATTEGRYEEYLVEKKETKLFLENWPRYKEKINNLIALLGKSNKNDALNDLLNNKKTWELILGEKDYKEIIKKLTSEEKGAVEEAIDMLMPFIGKGFYSPKEKEEKEEEEIKAPGEKWEEE